MIAFRIARDRGRRIAIDIGYDFHLPAVECLLCCPQWRNWGDGMIEYPAFQFDFLNPAIYDPKRVVSLFAFNRIRDKIQEASRQNCLVIPGASIGMPRGTVDRLHLNDFVWGRICVPQVSKRALELLARDGIILHTADLSLDCRGKNVNSHLAIQVKLANLLTEESRRRHKISHCPRCGSFFAPHIPDASSPKWYILDKSLWPVGHHLVQTTETNTVFASAQFIEAVKRNGLTGICFQERGELV